MAIQFWLTCQNEKIQLPVNPSSLSLSSPYRYEEIDIHGLGEHTLFKDEGLKACSLDSFFPEHYNETYCSTTDFLKPWRYIETIERWRREQKPVRLIVTGTPINLLMTIRDFNYQVEKAGHVGDILYTLAFKEYRFIHVRKVDKAVDNVKSIQETKTRPNTRETNQTYTIKHGDSLYSIAHREIGNGSKWRELYEKNKELIGRNPNLIRPGMKLVL